MKKIFAIIAFVTFSLSLSAAEEVPRIGTCTLQQLDCFDASKIDSFYASLPPGAKAQVSLEQFKRIFSSLVPCILSLHNSSGEEVSINRLTEELFKKLRKIVMWDVSSIQNRINSSKRRQSKAFERRTPFFAGCISCLCFCCMLSIACGSGFFEFGTWCLIGCAILFLTAVVLLILGFYNMSLVGKEAKFITLNNSELRTRQYNNEFLISLFKQKIQSQIPDFPVDSTLQLLEKVSIIGANGTEYCLVFCPREEIEARLQELKEILGLRGFFHIEGASLQELAFAEAAIG
jgi:hypothetical protein